MQTRKTVYLDHAASSPLRQQARDALLAYEEAPYAGANPNSLHTMGRQAARALDGARAELARCLGGRIRPVDVTFTSGGTESNNLAVLGMAEGARSRDRRRTCVVLSAIEHDSILDLVPMLHDRGFEVRLAKCDRSGVVTPELLGEALDASCALVSVMSANNETGVVQPVGQLARAAHAAGVLFHTDAVQAFGRIPLDLADVDAVSVAAHKIGGPVGIGALAVRGRVPLRPMMLGGGQELGRRPGTQDVSSALAFAAAATWCCANLEQNRAATAGLARGLYARRGDGHPAYRRHRGGRRPPARHRERGRALHGLRDPHPRPRPAGLRGLGRVRLLVGVARPQPRALGHGHPQKRRLGLASRLL